MTRAPWPAAMVGVASRLLSTTTISYSRPCRASRMSSITRATAFSSFMVIIATEIRWLMRATSYSDVWEFSIGWTGDWGLGTRDWDHLLERASSAARSLFSRRTGLTGEMALIFTATWKRA